MHDSGTANMTSADLSKQKLQATNRAWNCLKQMTSMSSSEDRLNRVARLMTDLGNHDLYLQMKPHFKVTAARCLRFSSGFEPAKEREARLRAQTEQKKASIGSLESQLSSERRSLEALERDLQFAQANLAAHVRARHQVAMGEFKRLEDIVETLKPKVSEAGDAGDAGDAGLQVYETEAGESDARVNAAEAGASEEQKSVVV